MGEQMSERDELARVVAQLLASGLAPKQARVVRIWGRDRVDASAGAEANVWAGTPDDLATEVADAALAWFAEHRGPRVVSTVEELDALPVGSVVRDPHGRAFEKFSDGWAATGLAGAHDVCARPATVLFTPTTESEDR